MDEVFANDALERCPIEALRPYAQNARTHSKKQIRQIANSIQRFGFTNPILIGDDQTVIAGHGRVEAAKLLGMTSVPIIRLSHLSQAERRAYVLADNKLALNAGWDFELLAGELQGLIDIGFDIDLTGFSQAEIDLTLEAAEQANVETRPEPGDEIPDMPREAVTRVGDLWQLDRHLLLCGDARDAGTYDQLCGSELADLVFTDPPYNVPIDGHVCGLGRIRHREFAMGAGEMSKAEFTSFLADTVGTMARHSRDGAILFVCMDWRHMSELLTAGAAANLELKNLCVWNKTNGGMGAFYRSKHELIFVFKKGTAGHVNNFGLGDQGRYRTNVWDYPGISSISGNRRAELEMHPTVKPIALAADAIFDCSRRGDIILDGFGGSGTTLMAAHKTGRAARLLELDPGYCDVIIRRFQNSTGKRAFLLGSGEEFDSVAEQRSREATNA